MELRERSSIVHTLVRYGVALLAVGLAAAVRLAMDSRVGDSIPYVTFLAAVAAVAWRLGFGPALLSAVVGYGVATALFIAPRGLFLGVSVTGVLYLTTYSMVCVPILLFSQATATARRRALERQQELEAEIEQRQQVEETLRDREDLGRVTNAIQDMIHACRDEDDILRKTLPEAAEALRCESAVALRRDGDGWILEHAWGLPCLPEGSRVTDKEVRHAVLAVRTQCPVAVDDVAHDDRVNAEFLGRCGIGAVLCVPLVARETALGVFLFHFHGQPFAFRIHHLDFANRLGGAVSLALENVRLFLELQEALGKLQALNDELERRVAQRTTEVQGLAAHLRALASRLGRVEQLERRRLALVLHDHVQQLLVGARMQLAMLRRQCEGGDGVDLCQDLDATLREAIDAARSLAVELSPPVLREAGLVPALEWLATRHREKSSFRVHVDADPSAPAASEETAALVFDCVRELLLNAMKHSGRDEAWIDVGESGVGHLRVVVRDAGDGFDSARLAGPAREASLGLFSIQQRIAHLGGEFCLDTAPGRGTTVTLTVPVATSRSRVEATA